MRRRGSVLVVAAVLLLAGCGGDDAGSASDETAVDVGTSAAGTDQEVPEVTDATATRDGDGTYLVEVTISSPYDRPERYADAWRVVGPDGTVFGVRELAHDHANEQPFTRSLSGVEIPADVRSIMVEARDLIGGWSGQTYMAEIPT